MITSHGFHLPDNPLERSRVVLIRASSREMDYDNLVSSFKPVLDVLQEHGILANDKPSNFIGGHPEYLQEPSGVGKGHCRVEVYEL